MLQPSLVLFVLNFWLPELCNDSIKERATLFDSLQLSSIPWGVIAFEVLYCYRKPSVLFIPVICYFQSSCTKPGLHILFLIVVCCCCCCCCFVVFFCRNFYPLQYGSTGIWTDLDFSSNLTTTYMLQWHFRKFAYCTFKEGWQLYHSDTNNTPTVPNGGEKV